MKRDILGREPKLGDKIIITSSKSSDLQVVYFAKFKKVWPLGRKMLY